MFKNKFLDTIFVIVRRVVYGMFYIGNLLPIRKNKIVILCYHSVGDDSWRYTVSFENLKKQMAYMLSCYQPITLEDVEKYIRGEIDINKPSFVVTFDDGYEDIFQTKEYFASLGISPTVFVLGDIRNANKVVMESDRPFLSNDQIRELKMSGWGVGCHTMTHSNLSLLSNEEIVYEMNNARKKLESELNFEIPYIAYPLGCYTDEVLNIFRDGQYRMGLSMDDGYVSSQTDIARVPRIGVDGSHTFTEFVATISDMAVNVRSVVKKIIRLYKADEKPGKSTSKHIDVVVKYFWPVVAGTEVNILETYSVLAESGWDVTIHTSRDILQEKNVLSLSEHHRGLWIRRYRFGLFGFWPCINWKSTGVVALHNFNIIPFFFIMLYVGFLKLLGKKQFTLVVVPHGGFVLYTKHFSFIKKLAISIFYYGLGTKLINATVDGIRSVSMWEKNEMISKGIKNELLKVITNGTELDAYADIESLASDETKNNVEKYGRYIVQMGRIDSVKNYETVIYSLKFIPNDVKYVVLGPIHDEFYANKLKKIVDEQGLSDRVVFTGVIQGPDKYYVLKHAKLMVHMSLWESYCNAVHEGLSQGLVCVVSNVTGLPELVKNGDSGYCIDPYDVKELSRRINALLIHNNSDELNIVSDRISKGVRSRSWRDVAHDYAEMVVA